MTRFLLLLSSSLLLLASCTAPSQQSFPEGNWEGIASLNDNQFFISLSSEHEQLSVTIGEMLASGMAAQQVQFKNNQWSFSVPIGPDTMQFVLTPSETDDSFSGKLLFQRRSGPITLYPGRYAPTHRRLEQPERTGDAVSVETPRGTLQGTYLTPEGEGPFPTVLIIAGSGPTDRDGNSELLVASNDNLWHLAHRLKEAGIASLRYDKFGVGESMPEDLSLIHMTTFDHYVEDAELWLQYMQQKTSVSSLGVLGHSEGSLIALLAAQRVPVDFVISVAGNGDPIDEQMVKQISRINEEAAQVLRERFDQVKNSQYELTGNLMVDTLVPLGQEGYLESWMQYHPSEILRETSPRTLVIWGDRDERLVNENDRFSQTDMPDHITFIEIPDMGHMLRKATNDADLERSYRDRTMELHPEFVRQVTEYILQEGPHDYQ